MTRTHCGIEIDEVSDSLFVFPDTRNLTPDTLEFLIADCGLIAAERKAQSVSPFFAILYALSEDPDHQWNSHECSQ